MSTRKSFSMEPFRATVSKSGISYSFGTKNNGITRVASGKIREVFRSRHPNSLLVRKGLLSKEETLFPKYWLFLPVKRIDDIVPILDSPQIREAKQACQRKRFTAVKGQSDHMKSPLLPR